MMATMSDTSNSPEKTVFQTPPRQRIHSSPADLYEGLDFITRCEKMCEYSDPDSVVQEVLAHCSELESLISVIPMSRSDIQRLVSLFNQPNFTEEFIISQTTLETNTIFCYLVESEFVTSEHNLLAFITQILAEIEDGGETESPQQNLENCVSLLMNFLNKFPNHHTSYSNCIIILKDRIESDYFSKIIKPNLTASIIELHTKLNEVTKLYEEIENTLNYENSFRSIDIFPSYEEIEHSRSKELRALVREGEYEDVESYLDIHFKLLREDMVYPIRKGLKSLKKLKRNSASSFYMYDNVIVADISAKKSHGLVYNLTFTPYGIENVKKYDWRGSDRLKFGSLLCISKKNKNGYPTFKNPFWAIVVCQKKKLLKMNQVSVRFKSGFEPEIQFNQGYFMIESREAYFEAYRHTLSVLQNTTEENLPFQDILLGKTNTCDPPDYIDENAVLHFGDLLPSPENQVRVIEEWPACGKLNDSQYRALKFAFSSAVALIQGAPGTGKSHVGFTLLKILLKTRESLLESEFPNEKLKSSLCDEPFVILTHSNNVLDQMLELVLTVETNIVRIGSRSEDDKIKSHSLHIIRKYLATGTGDRLPRETKRLINKQQNLKKELKSIKKVIEKYGKELEIAKKSSKMSISKEHLRAVATKEHFKSLYGVQESGFKIVLGKNRNVINVWLRELTKNVKICDEIKRKNTTPERNPFAILASKNLNDSEEFIVDRYLIEERRIEYLDLGEKDTDDEGDGLNEVEEDVSTTEETVEDLILRDAADKLKLAMQETEAEIEIPQSILETTNLWALNQQGRETLYQYWVKKLTLLFNHFLKNYSDLYSTKVEELESVNASIDLFIIRTSTVVGMTTTGAAKNSKLIRNLKPRIVIMDEASEVLEAEVIASLCGSVEHLVMMGDPLMMRPSTSVHRLSKRYNLNLSLFERLIINEFRHATLTLQHRMRPEISSIVQLLYPMITDQLPPTHYQHVQGIGTNLYFISHVCNEDPLKEDCTSRSNTYEAKFIIELALFLLVQGYGQDEVTILTFYNAQKCLLENLMKQRIGRNIFRIDTVDGYQGEENDIVILSVVRSNAKNNIGHCRVDNRVSVALSRAKSGFYVVGNEKCLRKASQKTKSSLWERVLDRFQEMWCIGNTIQLYCVKHGTIYSVKNTEEFRKINNGLCKENCKDCYPRKTAIICRKSLSCGHPCLGGVTDICSEIECSFRTTKHLPCGHTTSYNCNLPQQSVLSMKCEGKCSSMLECGHTCQGACYLCLNSNEHLSCIDKCSRRLICGHECSEKCHYPLGCPPCPVAVTRSCEHRKSTAACGEMSVVCIKDCMWKCEHFVCTLKCFEVCNRPCCDEGCAQKLMCGHACIGCCGEVCVRVCRVCKPFDDNFRTYFGDEKHPFANFVLLEDCGHIFEIFGLDSFIKKQLVENGNSFPKCPKCETAILNTRRYRYIVNRILLNIEDKKREFFDENKQILYRNWRKLRVFLAQNSTLKDILDILERAPILQCLSEESANVVNLYILSELLGMLQGLITHNYPLEVWTENSPIIHFFHSKQLDYLLHISPKNSNKNSLKNLNELSKINRKCPIYTMFKLMELEDMELWEKRAFNELKNKFELFATINPKEREKFLAYCDAFLSYLNDKYELSFPITRLANSFRRDWTRFTRDDSKDTFV